MIKLNVEIDDWDTGIITTMILPCSIHTTIDTTHDLQLLDWNADFSIERTDDIENINQILEDINSENPTITLDILEALLTASDSFLDDENFVLKMCSSDYMFEKIELVNSNLLRTDEEKCAYFLAVKMRIPFAKSITENELEEMSNISKINWKAVWQHYHNMGFELIKLNNILYAFHWGDADDEY